MVDFIIGMFIGVAIGTFPYQIIDRLYYRIKFKFQIWSIRQILRYQDRLIRKGKFYE